MQGKDGLVSASHEIPTSPLQNKNDDDDYFGIVHKKKLRANTLIESVETPVESINANTVKSSRQSLRMSGNLAQALREDIK